MVDARLKDGSRVNIVFMPLALDGPYISIRKFAKRKIDFDKMIEVGSLTRPVARVLEIAGRARLNVVISGGTGSGKTTMMNAMSRMIDHGERIVTVEDAAELQLQQPHVVRLETRPASLEGRGEINQRDLVRNALRMRPDRIIIGEVRGGEAFDMLQAMNTGHDGSMSTVHANTTRDALTRIENMVQMGNMGLPARAIRTQIVGAVDLMVQIGRQRDGTRRVLQVTDVLRDGGGGRYAERHLPVRGDGGDVRREADGALQDAAGPSRASMSGWSISAWTVPGRRRSRRLAHERRARAADAGAATAGGWRLPAGGDVGRVVVDAAAARQGVEASLGRGST